MFDGTAPDYDRVERMLAFGTGPWYRRQALRRAGLVPGMHVLDVGTGTGLVAREALTLCGPTGRVTGVDPSAGMMAQAQLADVRAAAGSRRGAAVRRCDGRLRHAWAMRCAT